MKKLFVTIIFVLFMFPAVVKADMGAPEIKPYEMVVIAPEGIDYYDYNHEKKGHLDVDTKFKVTFEYDGEYEISVSNNERGTIYTTEGAALVKEEYDPTESEDDDYVIKKKGKALIYAKDGVDMLKGPSTIYSKVKGGHIDEGEIVNYSYTISGGGYIYVEYDGKTGWVDILDKKVLFDDNSYYAFRKSYKADGVTIPEGTVLKSKYATDQWTGEHLFEYDGKEIMVSTLKSEDVLYINGLQGVAKKEFEIYEKPGKKGKVLATIKNGIEFIHYASSLMYCEGEGDEYVEYDGVRGWIVASCDDYELDWKKEVSFKLGDEEEQDEENDDIKEEKKEKKKNKKKQSASDYVLMYVIIGGAVALAGIIIIILINKNKKLKNN